MKDHNTLNENRKHLIIVVVGFLLYLLPGTLFSQKWIKAEAIASPDKETIGALAGDAFQNTYISGTFDNQLSLNGSTLTSRGFDDVFLSKINIDGQVDWTIGGGGSNFDQVSALAVDDNDDIIWGGQFWIEGEFEGITLPLVEDSRGIYLLKYNSEGSLIWGRTIEGVGLKILTDITTDEQNHIYLTGYFENTLLLEDTTLTGNAFQNLFLLKLDEEGQLIWARSAGYDGEIRPQTLATSETGEVLVAGAFKGKVAFAGDSIQTNTEDRDIFIAAFDDAGIPLWGRKAGGVYDEEVSAIAIGANDQIYLTGTFLGVLKFNESIEIQTDGFNENFFLASYDSNGTPLFAKSYGSTADETGHDLVIQEEVVYLTGNYFGDLRIDQWSISGSEDHFNGFLAAFDWNGTIQWLEGFRSTSYIEGNALVSHGPERLMLAGNFADSGVLSYLYLEGDGANDVFWGELNPLLTSSIGSEQELELPSLRVFPNPGNRPFTFSWESAMEFKSTHLEIYDLRGRLVERMVLNLEDENLVWEANRVAGGVYFYRVLGFEGFGKLVVL